MTLATFGLAAPIRPMLAAPQRQDMATLVGTHSFEVKLDGLRAILYWDGANTTILNRSLRDITDVFPEIARIGDALDQPMILDGEILTSDGRFESVARRGKQSKPGDVVRCMKELPAHFIAFDLLYCEENLMTLPYRLRRENLDAMLQDGPFAIARAESDPEVLWADVVKHGLEGMIAKNLNVAYMQAKRSPAWQKFKRTQSITCAAVGYEPGEGARAHFGAMYIALIGPDGPVPIGKVGTGFTAREIDELKALLDQGTPFPVEIEALNRTSGNVLRFPVYKGRRSDLSVTDCTIDQLDILPRC